MKNSMVIKESKLKLNEQISILELIVEENEANMNTKFIINALNALKEGLRAVESVENEPSKAGRKKTVDANLIKKLRNSGQTQEQVARKLNISTSTVRRNQ